MFFNHSKSSANRKYGFSLLEVLAVVSLVVIVVTVAFKVMNKTSMASKDAKLSTDIRNVNTAIKFYISNGGYLDETMSVDEVISKLKTIRETSSASSHVGFSGAVIDPRVTVVNVDQNNSGSRALWNPEKLQFEQTTELDPGYRFVLTDEMESFEQEERAESSFEYSSNSGWIWDYEVASTDYKSPTVISTNPTTTDNVPTEEPTFLPPPPAPSPAPEFFETPVVGSTIFVLDSSGSMEDNGRLDRLKREAVSILKSFDSNQYFGVIRFSGREDETPDILMDWGEANSFRIDSANSAILALEPDGNTDYHRALEWTLGMVNRATPRVKQVIFLSDGEPTREWLPESEVKSTEGVPELVDAIIAAGVERFDTLSMGEDREILAEMARGEGEYNRIRD